MSDASAGGPLPRSCRGPTGRRGGRIPACSLNDVIADEDGNLVELGDTLSEEDGQRRVGTWGPSQVELSDLAMDVEQVVARLPARLRKLCNRLKTASVSEVSRQTGVPEEKLHEDIKKVRTAFEDAGLAGYVPSGPGSVGADEASDG